MNIFNKIKTKFFTRTSVYKEEDCEVIFNPTLSYQINLPEAEYIDFEEIKKYNI